METGSKIDKLVIGARDLKGHLGRYLIQGLVVSVFLHSALIALVGLLPKRDQPIAKRRTTDSTIVDLRKWIDDPIPVPPRPTPPQKPDDSKFVPIEEEPEVIDSLVPEDLEMPDLASNVPLDGSIDTGAFDGISGSFGLNTGELKNAGTVDPWTIFVPREIDPQPLRDFNPQPAYPKLASKAGVEGIVYVWVHVSAQGDVIGWHVIDVRPAGLGFENEVARVIPQWKFTPGIQQNTPVAVWVSMPFKFKVSN